MAVLMLDDKSMYATRLEIDKVKKWCKALRSGEYIQTHNTMSDPNIKNSSCCLNVLECTIKGLEWDFYEGRAHPPYDETEAFNGVLSVDLKALSLSTHNKYKPNQWNDDLQLTFNQIADLLEHGYVQVDAELEESFW